MNLLIVEDDEKLLMSYIDVIESFNKKHVPKIIHTISKTLTEAKDKLTSTNFDAAIIDLVLKPAGKIGEAEGNDIIREVVNKLRFPIIVYSGNIGLISEEITENIFFKKHSRDSIEFDKLLEYLHNIYLTGITKILGSKGIIEGYLNDIFWTHISKAMQFWLLHKNEKTLLRYILSIINEHLELNNEGDFEYFEPSEFYITPPIKKFLFTGTILQKETNYFLVLSPACDLAQQKSKNILIAEIENLNLPIITDQMTIINKPIQDGLLPDAYKKAYDKKENSKEILRKIISNNYALKYHYLPPTTLFRGGIVNFQKISSELLTTTNEAYTPVASISGIFLKEVISRFSHYYSRQGQPDMNPDKLLESLMKDDYC